MERIFVDTSAWYAFLNSKDPQHQEIQNGIASNMPQLVTSNFIITEVLNLLVSRRLKHKAVSFGKTLKDKREVLILPIESRDEKEAWNIFEKYGDKDFSYTDCTSFALMKRLKVKKVIALDDDFVQMGFVVLPPF